MEQVHHSSLREVTLARRSDRELLELIEQSKLEENRHRARRLLAMAEFHRRRQAEQHAKADDVPFFVLTPLQETAAEVAPILGVTETSVELQLSTGSALRDRLPGLWSLCESGRLDIGKAELVLEAVDDLAHVEDIPAFAASIGDYLTRQDDGSALLRVTRSQLQRAVRYRRLKFAQKREQDGFLRRHARRCLRFRPDDNGMGFLSLSGMVTDAMAADYRITLIAKRLCADATEKRTLEQMRADVAMDLLLGRLTVGATTGELERETTDDGRDVATALHRHSVGGFARPVINVTVPIQTLMAVSDEPAYLSGDNPIPAELARIIASDPRSTWYRMLTDPARGCVELSTDSYAPTRPIWREVVATERTCLYPSCSRPAVQTELDHTEPYPAGPTSTANLGPLCRRHHKVKHSRGFGLTRHPDGSHTWTTKAGTLLRRPPSRPPFAEEALMSSLTRTCAAPH